MLMRVHNPWRDLTRQQKFAIGATAGIVLAGATIATVAWASKSDPKPPKKAIEVGPGCTSFAITSEQQLKDDLRARVRSAAAKGPLDPLQITAKYIRRVAPTCPTYPSKTETPGQVKLFAAVYTALLDVMQDDDFLSDADFPMWYGMMTTWAAGQGVALEDL